MKKITFKKLKKELSDYMSLNTPSSEEQIAWYMKQLDIVEKRIDKFVTKGE